MKHNKKNYIKIKNAYLLINDDTPILETGLIVLNHKGFPSVQIRTTISKPEIVKQIVNCAINQVPIVIIPGFNQKIKSLNSLIEKGILTKTKTGYEFLF